MSEFDSSSSSSNASLSTIDDSLQDESSIIDIKTKVDRKILDTMLRGGNQTLESADDFFVRVANESGAIIAYPRKDKLEKIGRREPEIRLFGNPLQVQTARNMILDTIGPYKNRVTLKIDISHFDHSHIIGKGGRRISNIMAATETHIHFPDCNRIESETKSNQVTIAGNSLSKVEEARRLIRENSPLTISFTVEVNQSNIDLLNPNHPNLQFYQKRYNVLITFKITEPSALNSSLITVQIRGTRSQFDELREAIRSVYTHITGSIIGFNSLVSTIETDISPQHHPFVIGKGNSNIKSILAHTGAIVTFAESSNSSANNDINNGRVVIKGRGVESAYLAWIELIGYLPLTMIFSLAPDHLIDSKLLQGLMNEYDLSIVIRHKMENFGKLLILKTQERNSHILFEARSRILGIKELPTMSTLSIRSEPKSTSHAASNNLSSYYPFNFSEYETECLRAFKPPFQF